MRAVPIDEHRATAEQVRRLVSEQCPQWARFPVTRLSDEVEGTDHVLFRIGKNLVARMPKIPGAVDQAETDARWLPALAPHLPVSIPVPVHVGRPGAGFPWPWTVAPWIDGCTPPRLGSGDVALARDVAAFAQALHRIDPTGGPLKPPGSRGSALSHLDEDVRRVLPRLAEHDDGFDPAEAAWNACVSAPAWDRDPVWIHGDLQPGNLIVDRDRGRLAAVIDFGALGIGDPAPDVAAAVWTFTGPARAAYRKAIDYDDATWLRACGWVLGPALTGIDYYRHTFPRLLRYGRESVRAVIAELRRPAS